jgi:tetratricopeptide (TPR) repeat protein
MMVYYEAIDQAGHEFMPFHPPRSAGVGEKDYHHWHPAIEGFYRVHDLMLGRLLELAGGDATVILLSDHGFASGDRRPGPVANDPATQAAWHRPQGILAIHGPGIAAGERLSGASLLDITPTVLHLLGLPAGEDMDGKVLAAAFTEPIEPRRIPSWENCGPPLAEAMPESAADEASQAALVKQFVALGYLEIPAGAAGLVREAGNELRFNESQALAAAGRWREAGVLLERLVAEEPGKVRYRIALVHALLVMENAERLREVLERMPEDWRQGAEGHLVDSQLLLVESRTEEAFALIREAAAQFPRHPAILFQYGLLLLRRRCWVEAERIFRSAIAADSDSEYAWHGLAATLVEQDRTEESIEAALQAVGLRHQFPEAHFVLGRALVRQGDSAAAIRALETALSQNPAHQASHSILSRLHFRLGNPHRSWEHREVLRTLRQAEGKRVIRPSGASVSQ